MSEKERIAEKFDQNDDPEKEPDKTSEMIQYEQETGRNAIWHGVITEGFKNWLEGKKIYSIDKKVIGVLVTEDIKSKWEEFTQNQEIPTVPEMIRQVVNFYIDNESKIEVVNKFSKIGHSLKENLTSIQGYSQLIIDNEATDLKPNVLLKIKEIYTQSLYLENKINDLVNDIEPDETQYDILIIEDNTSTITVLKEFFESKSLKCKGVTSGTQGLDELSKNIPKIILIDIILPDVKGYEICKQIKTQKELKNIPVFYITAVPESEVKEKIKETKADGFFLKPFKFPKFEVLLKYI
ncbi:MAG: PleD family two-component system response regulator [Candidatus Hermodarchaeota archaeon]